MAAVEVTISGVLYDKHSRTTRPVVLIGEASLTGLGVGGGPIQPPGSPPGIWGPDDPRPGVGPILPPGWESGNPPGIWGPTDPRPGYGLPDWQPPPGFTPPEPGDPPILVGGDRVTHPIVTPPFIVVHYPGMGLVIVPQPLPEADAQPKG